jgi:hypothetical protein
MKLTKGKINKIKKKRLQSKKRFHRNKHLVKYGRRVTYRKKRHFNLKNQTLKRFGVKDGGTGPDDANDNASNNASVIDKTIANDSGKNNASDSGKNNADAIASAKTILNADASASDKTIASGKTILNTDANSIANPNAIASTINNNNSSSTNNNNNNSAMQVVAETIKPIEAEPIKAELVVPHLNVIGEAVNEDENSTISKIPALPAVQAVQAVPLSDKNKKSVKNTTIASLPVSNSNKNGISSSDVINNNNNNNNTVKKISVQSKVVTQKQASTTSIPRPVESTEKKTAPLPMKEQPSSSPSSSSSTLINLPEKFGPSTKLSEIANYFANIVLIQLMSKFDVNTKMTLDDFLKAVVKNSTLTSSNDNANNNSSNNNKITGKTVNPNATSKNLLNSLNDNSNNTGISNSTYQREIPVGVPVNDPNANMMGMNNGYGQGYGQGNMSLDGLNSLNSLFGNRTSEEEKDTRKREEIQNENVEKSLENSNLSRENEEHKKEIERLQKEGGPDSKKEIDRLHAEIAKNENNIEGNNRTIKENDHAINKTKTTWEKTKEMGTKAKDALKSGATAIASAPGVVYEKGKKIFNGKDIDVLDTEHANLSIKLSDKNTELAKLQSNLLNRKNDEGEDLNLQQTKNISNQIKKIENESKNIQKQQENIKRSRDYKELKIKNIINKTIKPENTMHHTIHSVNNNHNKGNTSHGGRKKPKSKKSTKKLQKR